MLSGLAVSPRPVMRPTSGREQPVIGLTQQQLGRQHIKQDRGRQAGGIDALDLGRHGHNAPGIVGDGAGVRRARRAKCGGGGGVQPAAGEPKSDWR